MVNKNSPWYMEETELTNDQKSMILNNTLIKDFQNFMRNEILVKYVYDKKGNTSKIPTKINSQKDNVYFLHEENYVVSCPVEFIEFYHNLNYRYLLGFLPQISVALTMSKFLPMSEYSLSKIKSNFPEKDNLTSKEKKNIEENSKAVISEFMKSLESDEFSELGPEIKQLTKEDIDPLFEK